MYTNGSLFINEQLLVAGSIVEKNMANTNTQTDSIDIKKLALVAGLSLSTKESPVDQAYLGNMLNWADTTMTMQIDAQNADVVTHVFNTTQRLRTDAITETNQREAYQAVAPRVEKGLYLVPSIIE